MALWLLLAVAVLRKSSCSYSLGGASSAGNEAVAEGAVSLLDYAGVVWLLGDESTADLTLDPAGQAVAPRKQATQRTEPSGRVVRM